MGFIIKLIITAVAAGLSAYLLPGVHITSITSALVLALVLAVLNAVLRPILVLLTIPVTVVTLGLFLLIINAIIVLIADALIGGFEVTNFMYALLFSIVLSVISYILELIFGQN
jgi:putative membrane protein